MTPRERVGARSSGAPKSGEAPTILDHAPSWEVVRGAAYVAIVGSRDFPTAEGRERVARLVDHLSPNVTVVTGGARGVDSWAEAVARQQGLCVAVVRPMRQMKADFMNRNTVIVRGADVVVAFWDGKSAGTADALKKALRCHGFAIVVMPGAKPEVWVR